MLEIWKQYAQVKAQGVIQSPMGLMYVLMRRGGSEDTGMRPHEQAEGMGTDMASWKRSSVGQPRS